MELSQDQISSYMIRCIELANQEPRNLKGLRVGALVLSKDGDVVGEGYRSFVKGTAIAYHAERMALDNAGEQSHHGVLFTTMEPCIPLGNGQIFTSCSQLIVSRGIDLVVIGTMDEFDQINGRGVGYLERNNIGVIKYFDLRERIDRELRTYRNRMIS